MLFYYKFMFMLLQRELKYSHEVRILDRILKRSGSEKQSHCFFTNTVNTVTKQITVTVGAPGSG